MIKISNAQLREFREYLFENQGILTELVDLSIFKQKLWVSYLKENKDIYDNLLSEYRKGQDEIKRFLKKQGIVQRIGKMLWGYLIGDFMFHID